MNRLYAYLYDDFLADRQYDRALANLETRTSALGIHGRHARLAIFRSAKELVEGLVREGAETIVVVGNDHSLMKTMWFLPSMNVTVGYIPVAEPHGIAEMLGIPAGDDACDVLAGRRIETVDIGMLGDRFFLTEVYVDSTKASVDIDGYFRISPQKLGTISIRNLGSVTAEGATSNARDGWLEVVIRPVDPEEGSRKFKFLWKPKLMQETRLLLQKGSIISDEPIDIVVDGYKINGFRFELGVIPKKLKLITGRKKKLDPSQEDLSNRAFLGTFTPAENRK